ncbi:unnamed protein product [Didymodactylos carnosus]|uniref:Uncharacterized protein n=1 Tax=Didymodactylos carnosus TaxID=1234261 RepID=A0A8S2CXI7_9BILA|nr:unnamed protein product [Didymodactylos carnosus]CAF3529044.1 unnamed protein product [Didymodactylos carnosus]
MLMPFSLLEIRRKVFKRLPPLRVYPYEQTPILRTNQTHDEILTKMRKENLTDEEGHLGKVESLTMIVLVIVAFCEFRRLKHFDVGQSWLLDNLHTCYEGVMRKLLTLWLDVKYRMQPWSVRSKLDKLQLIILDNLRMPNTTSRRPRRIAIYNSYKAS